MLTKKIEVKSENMSRLKEYREYLRMHPKLTYLFVELTEQCNLSCLHCGSSCSLAEKRYIDTKLILQALETVAEDFVPSTVMICLTGGEPLLHPDFWVIVERIVALEFPWGMTTNGTLIDEEKAFKLKHFGLGSITISLDGLKETHEWLRNNEGCFDRTRKAIASLHMARVPVQITTVVHKKNFEELPAMYSLMCEWGIASWRIINVEPIGRALQKQELLLGKVEMLQLLEFVREKRYATDTPMDVCFGCSHYLSFEYEHEVRDNYFICGAGIYVGSILVNGDIYSCLDIERRRELVQGNVATDRFSEVWNNKFKEFRMNRAEIAEECRLCKERDFCEGDSMHTWDFKQKKPMFCMLRGETLYAKLD